MSERSTSTSGFILIGMKHCGKSTLGRMAAERLSMPFYDLDELVLRKIRPAGYLSVRELYRNAGVKKFQEYEYSAALELAELFHSRAAVAALGGGTVENPPAMELLKPLAPIFHLEVDEDELFRRISESGIPPFLEGDESPRILFSRLLARRTPLYSRWALRSIRLPAAAPQDNVSRILSCLETEVHDVG